MDYQLRPSLFHCDNTRDHQPHSADSFQILCIIIVGEVKCMGGKFNLKLTTLYVVNSTYLYGVSTKPVCFLWHGHS